MKALAVIVIASVVALSAAPPVSAGLHLGDQKPIEVEVVYLSPPGILTIDEEGATYYFPEWNLTIHEDREYDERYYGTYPVYFIGQTMHFEIRVRNRSARTYRNLLVEATQEYHLASGATYGEPLPGESTQKWFVERLGPNEEVVLKGAYYASPATLPGLDQTHVSIYHWSNGERVPLKAQALGASAPGRLFWDDPEAGVYCPPSFFVF
jgi:hypothetical protein